MTPSVPVHVDVMPTEVRGECARCGKCAAAAVSQDHGDGSPKRRKDESKREVLALLTAACAERLPLGDPPGIPPHHYDRQVPRGLALYARDHHEQLHELFVNEKGKLETVAGGCDLAATVLVVPDAKKDMEAAVAFAKALQKRGYRFARTARVGYAAAKKQQATQGAQQ